jgi:hypothetical protein
MLKFIISNAIKEYKNIKNEQIKKTELAKLIYHLNSELKLDLPIVWYLYGPMPLMILDLQKDYSTDFVPDNSESIKKEIIKWVKEKTRMHVKEMVKELYLQANAQLYDIKQKLFDYLQKGKLNNLGDLSREFYLYSLASDSSKSDLVYEFYNIVSGLEFLNKLNKEIASKILLALDGIWKYLASKTLYNSLLKLKYPKEEVDIYLCSVIETKKYLAEEALNNLNEAYTEILPSEPIKLKENDLSKKIANVTDKWLESESWRE